MYDLTIKALLAGFHDHFNRGRLSLEVFSPIFFPLWKLFDHLWLAGKKHWQKAGPDWSDHVNWLYVKYLQLMFKKANPVTENLRFYSANLWNP